MKTDTDDPKILSANKFPVVGIGASAGGLNAFKQFIKAIPEKSGMAYVLVQHLDPSHQSILPELLQKVTPIPVLEISDDIRVEPDHIYIIPSNKMMIANDGVLQLSPRPEKSKNVRNLPIDMFFTSLAEIHQAHAIGVVLSGTASDGTAGLKAIKDQGGITFAQDEESAEYDSMPRSAAQAGVVDFTLPADEMPKKLAEIKQQINHSDEDLENLPQQEDIFRQMLFLLRLRKGTDFTYYKQTTLRRRIFRRMALNNIQEPAAYLKALQEDKKEQDALYQDMLIPVTAFFRDHKVFDALCESVFPHLVRNKATTDPIRVWIAGCSTGQEAYSMAMCLKEFIGQSGERVQIFATDISEPAIAKARTGIYLKNEMEGVEPHRLQEFFTKTDNGYRINKDLREMCVFAVHNFLKDPPFGKIDFISCRNVLIYMEPYLQKKALTTFHYALNLKGFLLLGKSETSGSVPHLFSTAAKQDKLFTRKDVTGKYMHVATPRSEQSMLNQNKPGGENLQTDFQKTADELLLSKYTPAGVVVNEAMDIVHFRGNTGDYLEQAPGKPSHNLLKMARAGLGFELRNIIQKSKKEKKEIIKEGIPLIVGGIQQMVTIQAIPLPDVVEPHFLVLFHETLTARPQLSATGLLSGLEPDEKELHIQQLEKELAHNREDMRSITEDQEAANEELQSSNEELLSSSEEMQSLNEELEASKEELQSTNEELTVLNQELHNLNEQLGDANIYQTAARKKMEAQALMVNNLLMTAPGFICTMVGPQHVYDIVNEQYQQLFGKRQIKGKPLLEALPELQGQGFDTLLDKVYTTGEPYVGLEVLIALARDENMPPEDRFFNFSYQPMYDEHKSIYAILVFGYEVTEQVLAKNSIQEIYKKHANELEEKVVQRTQELLEANQALSKTNKELESFTYVSSHDLQEPLRKIQTFASHIANKEAEALSDYGKDCFRRIIAAAARMQTLIQDLLVYSHTHVTERHYEPTDVNAIITDVASELEESILKQGAVIDAGNLCEVYVNPSQFRQVFYNLISNSLKFSKSGAAPHITIRATDAEAFQYQKRDRDNLLSKLAAGKRYCHISFRDNGIGFDPRYNEKIFEVFQRLHSKAEYTGTGIGLAIVKKIVEHHEGIVTASGVVGQGATFDIYIPAAESGPRED